LLFGYTNLTSQKWKQIWKSFWYFHFYTEVYDFLSVKKRIHHSNLTTEIVWHWWHFCRKQLWQSLNQTTYEGAKEAEVNLNEQTYCFSN
jgi:hypothetical protein